MKTLALAIVAVAFAVKLGISIGERRYADRIRGRS